MRVGLCPQGTYYNFVVAASEELVTCDELTAVEVDILVSGRLLSSLFCVTRDIKWARYSPRMPTFEKGTYGV